MIRKNFNCIILVFCSVFMLVVALDKECCAGVRLILSASPSSLPASGGSVDVSVGVDADVGQSYDGVEFLVLFDPSVLNVESIVVDSTKLPLSFAKEFDNALGRVHVAQAANLGSSTNGSFTFATIRFRALNE